MLHLKELRIQKGNITQAELAKQLKVSASTIGMYEQGRREPDAETLNKLATFFHVSTDYLLGRTDAPQQSPAAARQPRLSADALTIAEAYDKADDHTRVVINTVLQPFIPAEKEEQASSPSTATAARIDKKKA